MKRYSLLFILFVPLLSFSQSSLLKSQVDQYTTMFKEAQGTYQIQMINTKKMPAIPIRLISDIEKQRHQSEVKYLFLDENIKIMILPKDVIENSEFVQIEKIIHLSSLQKTEHNLEMIEKY